MELNSKIYVAGHRGLVGSAIVRNLEAKGYTNIIYRTHKELDLTNQADVQAFFKEEQPEYVILAAAKVGGIHANNTYPADFKPADFVLSMNETHTVREFVELAFAELGYELEWQGEGVDEKGIDKKSGRVLVEVDPRYFRPAEVELLWGDSTKARTELGWEPKYSFMDLVKEMVQSDLEELKNGGGYKSKFEN